jgi:hypothetical protein
VPDIGQAGILLRTNIADSTRGQLNDSSNVHHSLVTAPCAASPPFGGIKRARRSRLTGVGVRPHVEGDRILDACGFVPPHRNPVDEERSSCDMFLRSNQEGNARFGWPKSKVRKLVAEEYEPATAHEKEMPINNGRSEFSE